MTSQQAGDDNCPMSICFMKTYDCPMPMGIFGKSKYMYNITWQCFNISYAIGSEALSSYKCEQLPLA